MKRLLTFLLAVTLLPLFGQPIWAADAPRSTYAGTFAGEKFRIELQTQDGKNYTGTIFSGEQKFPVTARDNEKALVGEFEAGGNKYAFEATQGGGQLTLVTGGATHTLKKAVVNPLGNPGAAADPVLTATPQTPAKSDVKDPLAYKVLTLPGGTAAKFDNWQYSEIMSGPNLVYCDAVPQGRKDFVLRTVAGTPNDQDMANFFTTGPQLCRQGLAQLFGPVFKPKGEAQKCTCGGDEAMVEEYAGDITGTAYTCRVMYVKRKDVAVAVMAIGTEAGFKDFGRAIEIAAQSITLKDSTIDPGLLGTWTKENFVTVKVEGPNKDNLNLAQARSITFYPNGTFSDTAQSGFSGNQIVDLVKGGNRGNVVKRGNVLTFHYDNGSTWSPAYELYPNGLKIDGQVYLK